MLVAESYGIKYRRKELNLDTIATVDVFHSLQLLSLLDAFVAENSRRGDCWLASLTYCACFTKPYNIDGEALRLFMRAFERLCW